MASIQKITPFIWFDNQAEEAANFYVSIFQASSVNKVVRNGEAVMVVDFTLGGRRFSALNGGPMFKINPSISFFVTCGTEAETDAIWQRLSEGGTTLMAFDKYPWSQKYGWVQDRYGLTWQVQWEESEDKAQSFVPSMLFTGPQSGKAEAAIAFYTSIFGNASTAVLVPYGAEGPGPEGTVMFARFLLEGQEFIAMDDPMQQQNYTFNEALSFVINCDTQEQVDFFWGKLTSNGGQESQCGWLKDRFGVSWQVVPEALPRLLADPATAQTAMANLMQMRKIEIHKLTEPLPTTPHITVQANVNAPIEKVWACWTGAEHIVHWNNASDDWHTPQASNDLRPGGNFSYTMAAKDGSFSFDFQGVYDEVIEHQRIAYTIADGRRVSVSFAAAGGATQVTETFDAENMHSPEMQRAGWQAILDNFKRYAEN